MLLHLKVERSYYICPVNFLLESVLDFQYLHSRKSRFVCSRRFSVKKCVRTVLLELLLNYRTKLLYT